jgi:hypothetical protein
LAQNAALEVVVGSPVAAVVVGAAAAAVASALPSFVVGAVVVSTIAAVVAAEPFVVDLVELQAEYPVNCQIHLKNKI